jgi:hypothetical protein
LSGAGDWGLTTLTRCELTFSLNTTGLPPATEDTWGTGVIAGRLGTDVELRVTGRVVTAQFEVVDSGVEGVAYELIRVLRGAFGFHFGQPVEVFNVSIRTQDGAVINTLPRRQHRIGFADVSNEELRSALEFTKVLAPDSAYARALEYFNQGRLLLQIPLGMPEAPVIFFYKVAEALLPMPKKRHERSGRWIALGFSVDEIASIERLRRWRNEFDAAHSARATQPGRVRMDEAGEAEEIAQLILERVAPALGLPNPRASPRRVTLVPNRPSVLR